jgi:hypothetical protein
MPALLFANWKPIVLAVVLLGAFAYRATLLHQRDAARAESAAMAIEVADLKSAEAACQAAVARQNDAVNGLKLAAETAVAAAASRTANLASAANLEQSREEARAAEVVRAPIAADCAGAIRWANGQAPALGKW